MTQALRGVEVSTRKVAMCARQTYPDIVWNGLDVRSGAFTDNYTIGGSFYGPDHEEAGGVFDRGPITGTFGAKRED